MNPIPVSTGILNSDLQVAAWADLRHPPADLSAGNEGRRWLRDVHALDREHVREGEPSDEAR